MSDAPTRIGYNAFACYEGNNLAIEAPRDQSVECRHLGSVRILTAIRTALVDAVRSDIDPALIHALADALRAVEGR